MKKFHFEKVQNWEIYDVLVRYCVQVSVISYPRALEFQSDPMHFLLVVSHDVSVSSIQAPGCFEVSAFQDFDFFRVCVVQPFVVPPSAVGCVRWIVAIQWRATT